jgi:hypothetical protein
MKRATTKLQAGKKQVWITKKTHAALKSYALLHGFKIERLADRILAANLNQTQGA